MAPPLKVSEYYNFFFNSILSTPNARFSTLDIMDYYLNMPMEPKDYAYMRIALNTLPPKIMNE
jgi:hypothetical protein